jgi:beta-lactamase regulating signal transducer with metallopeptidase domain
MLWWLAQNALSAGLLSGLVALVCRLGRFRPAVRHALWLVVLVKLITPPFLEWPWAVPSFVQIPASAAIVDAATAPEPWLPSFLEQQTFLISDGPPPGAAPGLAPIAPRAPDEPRSSANQAESADRWPMGWLEPTLYTLWLAGTAIMWLLQTVRITRFRRLLIRARPAPPSLEKLVAQVAGAVGVRRPRTLIVAAISSPFVWSLCRPKLLWPASLLERLPNHSQRSVIAHELAHLRRRDHWVGWLQLVAECVWWWNPLFWCVRRQLRLNAELACDAWVVALLPEDRRAYAEALLEVTQLISRKAAPIPALGMSSAAHHDLERRLTMIMRDCTPCRLPRIGLLAIAALALVSLPGWSQVERAPEASPTKEEPAKHVILNVATDIDVQDALHVLNDVEGTVGERRFWIATADTPAPTDRDNRLRKLEERLEELLKEVQALRGSGPGPQNIIRIEKLTKPGEASDRPRVEMTIERYLNEIKHDPAAGAPETVIESTRALRGGKESADVVTLSRAIYKLPHAKAEALGALLKQHSKVEILEARVEGDSLVITTTPEAQRAIAQFVSLIQGRIAALHIDRKSKPAEAGPEKPAVETFEFKKSAPGEKR